ncbi:MAG TPA: LuxR C-terminal-related transcriptional regulator [Thermoanaerobaculia bacterium]
MWTQLRNAIDSISPELTPDELDRQKGNILAIIGTLEGGTTPDTTYSRLSPREREVMTMMLTGKRLKEIAAVLNISVKTVTTHRARLMRKLGVTDNIGLYRYGVRNGLVGV